MELILGVDLGGTNIVVGAVGADNGKVHGLNQRRTPVEQGPDGVIDRISAMIHKCQADVREELGDEHEILGIGIGSPGPLNRKTGVVITTPNLRWRNVPIRDRVSEAAGLPAALDNDANCAILGESWLGAAQGARYVVGLTIGTGIGGGIVLDGEVFHGAVDVAGEFGHMTINIGGRRCGCGNYGCLEAYASGPAIAARAVEGIEANSETVLPELVDGDLSQITAETVYRAATEGDGLALDVVKDTARFLGAGVATLVNIFNPEVVVVCGGVTKAGPGLFGPLVDEVKRRAFKPGWESCRVVPGELPGIAGVLGAAGTYKIEHLGGL